MSILSTSIVLGSILIKAMSGNALIGIEENFQYPNIIFVDPEFDSIGNDRLVLRTVTDNSLPTGDSLEPNDMFKDATPVTNVHAYDGSYRTALMGATLCSDTNENDIDFYSFYLLSDALFSYQFEPAGWNMAARGAKVTIYKREVTQMKQAEYTVYTEPKQFYQKTITAKHAEQMPLKAGSYVLSIEGTADASQYTKNEKYNIIFSCTYLKRPSHNIYYLKHFKGAQGAFWEADYFPYMTYDANFMSWFENTSPVTVHYPETANRYDFMPYDCWVANGKSRC